MAKQRKQYSATFKAQVALEAIKGDLTVAQLAAKIGQLVVERDFLKRASGR